ncbi:MAG TPA: zinc-binding alcohol dehydrogenase family protein [Candidatus Cybelea sp.]|jgi:NADPH:quinone reductase-like Zn-dependent oxidoreductase|nr:zinc-binding alcohol dehydrogenase family protein [Candidatus Cybelea sp.]
MKAAVIDAPGESARYGDFAEPGDREGRRIVELVAAGIHPVVRGLASGRHYGSTGQWPLVPGIDAVVRAADGALAYSGFPETPYGTLAERISVPSFLWMPIPEGADPARVAGGVNPGMASWLPLQARRTEIGRLNSVLILGVTGMAGLLAAQNARILGAARIAGAGRDAHGLSDAAKAGATTIKLSGDRERDGSAILEALAGSSPDIVLDFLWGEPAESAFAALGKRGLEADRADISYVQIGAAAGAQAAVPAALLRSRKLRITGSGSGSASLANIIAEIPGYIQLISDGGVEVPIRTFPLSRDW